MGCNGSLKEKEEKSSIAFRVAKQGQAQSGSIAKTIRDLCLSVIETIIVAVLQLDNMLGFGDE